MLVPDSDSVVLVLSGSAVRDMLESLDDRRHELNCKGLGASDNSGKEYFYRRADRITALIESVQAQS